MIGRCVPLACLYLTGRADCDTACDFSDRCVNPLTVTEVLPLLLLDDGTRTIRDSIGRPNESRNLRYRNSAPIIIDRWYFGPAIGDRAHVSLFYKGGGICYHFSSPPFPTILCLTPNPTLSRSAQSVATNIVLPNPVILVRYALHSMRWRTTDTYRVTEKTLLFQQSCPVSKHATDSLRA